jgi:hypothetical protein
MMRALRIETVRGRLTAYYVTALAAALLIVGGLIYALLARALYARIDDHLHALVEITTTSLTNALGEGQDVEDAARSTAAELSSRQQRLAIYDGDGRLLAEGGQDDDWKLVLPAVGVIPMDEVALQTVVEEDDDDDRHRLAIQRVIIAAHGAEYIVVAASSLESTDEELESLRDILAYIVPIALLLAGIGGWFLARQSLSPVVAMGTKSSTRWCAARACLRRLEASPSSWRRRTRRPSPATRNSFGASSATSSTTPYVMRRRTVQCTWFCGRRPAATPSASGTRGLAFPPKSSRSSSTVFAEVTSRAFGKRSRTAAPGSASPWRGGSRASTAGMSR